LREGLVDAFEAQFQSLDGALNLVWRYPEFAKPLERLERSRSRNRSLCGFTACSPRTAVALGYIGDAANVSRR